MKILFEKDSGVLSQRVGEYITSILETISKPVLFCSSGGSTLSILPYIKFAVLKPERLTFAVLDERYTSDPMEQNTTQLIKAKPVECALSNGSTLIDIRKEINKPVEVVGKKLAEGLLNWRLRYPEGVIISSIGIGMDGHTAGIMPDMDEERFNQRFLETESFAIGYSLAEGSKFDGRITATYPFITKEVNVPVVYTVGNEKCSGILKELTEGKQGINIHPAEGILDLDALTLATDCEDFAA